VNKLFEATGKVKGVSDILRFYTGPGFAVIEDLPKVTKIAETAGITDEKLLKEIFTQRAVQKVMLDHADDPALVKRAWELFNSEKKIFSGPRTLSTYLETLGYDIRLTERTGLLKTFSEFASWTPSVKRLKLLETTEPELAKRIERVLKNSGESPFSKNLTRKLKEFFRSELDIKDIETATLQATRADLEKQLYKLMGENAYDAIEVKKIMVLMNRGDSKTLVLEQWAKVSHALDPHSIVASRLVYIRKRAYLTPGQITALEQSLGTADESVLKVIAGFTEKDFADMATGFVDNPQKFEEAIKSVDKFVGTDGREGFLEFWRKTPKWEQGLETVKNLKAEGKLLPTGKATDKQLAAVQNYTAWGNFLNVPMRYGEHMGAYAKQALKELKEGLAELRKVPERNMNGQDVFSGKAYTKADFDKLFKGKAGTEVEINKGFVSSTFDENVAVHFAEKTAEQLVQKDGGIVKVIRRIKTKTGVYVDDLSDYGRNLGTIRHPNSKPIEQIQEEVLMEEGLFKQLNEPEKFRTDPDGTEWFYIDFEELGKPLNKY
jgi:serine/threonine protein phosphatase PrpC